MRAWILTCSLLLAGPALADDAGADLSAALEAPKKAKWDPKGKSMDPYGRGDAKRKKEEWGEAIQLLVESLDAQPGCGKCLNALSLALIGADRHDDAVKVGELLTTLYPDRDEGWKRISDAHTDAMHRVRAVEATTQVLDRDKDNLSYWWRRNRLLLELGRTDEANTLLDGAKDAGIAEAAVACLRLQLRAANEDAAGARELWPTCDVDEADLDLRRYSEGWLALAEGDTELAAKRLVMSGADDFARATIAWLRIDQGKHDAALNLCTKLLETQADAWDVQLAHALALNGLGKHDEALAALESKLMAPGWPEAHAAVKMENVVLQPNGQAWPKEVARRAAALAVAIRVAKGDVTGAKEVYDQAVKVHGETEDLKAALGDSASVAEPPPAPAPVKRPK